MLPRYGFKKMELGVGVSTKGLSAVESLMPFMMVGSPLAKDLTIVVHTIETYNSRVMDTSGKALSNMEW